MAASTSKDSSWLPPTRLSDIDVESEPEDDMDGRPPVHPVPTMQGAFEESMMETLNETDDPDLSDRYSTADSVSRRKMLLEQAEYERTVAGRWKQKPGEKFHPLWKLVAQISFGMHLLQQGLAKSDEEVIKILQTHVDEVDGFLERTTEDFDLAQGDINERIRYLRLPLEHGHVFDGMLNDRSFRIAIVEGNEKIEHIIDRTAAAMTDALKDVQKGLDATRELAKYLTKVDKRWDHRTDEHDSVYLAMIGNTEGWTRAFLTLQAKGNTLRKALVQLGGIVAEMQKRAGAASRKNLVAVRSINGRYYVERPPVSPRIPLSPPKSPHKPLPKAPDPSARPGKAQKSPHLSVETTSKNSKHKEPKHKEPASPYLEQAMAAKRVEPVMRVTSSERSGSTKSHKLAESIKEVETAPSNPATQPTSMVSKPSLSRKGSISDRTRSMTRKLSFFRDRDENKHADTIVPAQGPHARAASADIPSSSILRRLSSRKGDRASLSMYSASPTTPTMRTGSPLVREASPPHTSKSGEPVPTQSSYGTLSLLPMHSAISPLTDSSFSFGQEAKSHERSQSANDQTMAPVVIRRDFERGNRNFHPLSNEVYPDTEGAKSSSYPPPFSSQIEKESDVKASTLPSKAAHGHKNETDQPHHASTFAEDESKHDQNEAREPASVSDKDIDWDINTAHALMIAAQESLKQSERPSSPAVSELEAPLPSSHPLLLEARHTQFSSNATPSTAPRNFLRDLPLRHYHSQEQFHSPGFSASRENEPTSKLRRSSSVLQRGSTQLSPDTVKVLNNTLPPNSSLSPAPIQSSSTPSPLRVVTDMNSTQIESSNLNQSTKPSPGRDVISERSSNSVPEQHPPFLAPTRSLTPIIAENINASANPVNSPTKPKKLSPTSPTHKPLTSSQEPDLCPAAKYKTSAENNVPFYLNPVSSTALADFLSPTHRSSSPHPGAQVCPNSGNPGHPPFTFEENTRVEDSPSPNSAAPAPIVAGAPIPPAPGVHSRIGTRSFSPPAEAASSTPPSPVAEKKHKWKNVFGSRGAARQKSAKTGPKVVIVGKGEWYKIERKKKGQKDSKDLKDVKDLNGPGESPSTAEAGFMGVGKDGVWISRKNFVKT